MLKAFRVNRSIHSSISDVCSSVSLSRLFITRSYPEANILQSHVKVITQLGKSIGTNYSKNVPDGDQFSTLGGRKCEPSRKDWFKSLRKAWRMGNMGLQPLFPVPVSRSLQLANNRGLLGYLPSV